MFKDKPTKCTILIYKRCKKKMCSTLSLILKLKWHLPKSTQIAFCYHILQTQFATTLFHNSCSWKQNELFFKKKGAFMNNYNLLAFLLYITHERLLLSIFTATLKTRSIVDVLWFNSFRFYILLPVEWWRGLQKSSLSTIILSITPQ